MEIRPSPKWAYDPWFCHSCGSKLGIGRYPRFKNGTRNRRVPRNGSASRTDAIHRALSIFHV